MAINAGPRVPDIPLPQLTCRLHATRRGPVFRPTNHSCEPNTKAVQMRYGMHHRIVVIVATEDSEPGDQITLFYNKTWFNDENPCRCRKDTC
ncbi:uncharacterized protein M421DRAFT_420753, partial [Didymella exigua CBS 183.55]